MKKDAIKLTQYSHGAGCGCKIAPAVLDEILSAAGQMASFPGLLVGNEERDDAAVLDLGDGSAIISTTDFFMPIVDDPETFGQIAATNAISDVYAMGGKPLMAIAILGWPVNMLSAELAGIVVRGAQKVCHAAGIPLAGGHSIDTPEPIFGLAVTGRVQLDHIKRNRGAQVGDLLFLTKPLGIGIWSTALKLEKLLPGHSGIAETTMLQLNQIGERFGKIRGVHAMTDVTGFGLAGHLLEMCRASDVSAHIEVQKIPLLHPALFDYIRQGCVPAGSGRNFTGTQGEVLVEHPEWRDIVCDPQTSGGLLIAVDPDAADEMKSLLRAEGLPDVPIGSILEKGTPIIQFIVDGSNEV